MEEKEISSHNSQLSPANLDSGSFSAAPKSAGPLRIDIEPAGITGGGNHPENSEGEIDEEEEEISEPPFKYIRILNDLTKIFNSQDAASCFAVHCKYLVVGTQWGCVYVLDHAGNMIPKKVVRPHTVAVNQLSIDSAGEYIASCANDGKVAIYGLCDGQLGQIVAMDRPIRAVAIDPDYSRATSARRFVTGDRNLIVHERGLFTKHKQYDVFAGKERDGYIHVVTWRGSYIAFANDTGVRVYDKSSEMMITHVERRHDLTLRCELYPARIAWYNDRNFVIAWANTVTVCTIKDAAAVAPDMRNKMVEIRYLWDIPLRYVAGVAFATGGMNSAATTTQSESRASIDMTATTWNELVLFCVCRRPLDGDGVSEFGQSAFAKGDMEQDELERPMYPRVLLMEPLTFNTFSTVAEDIIEMRESEKLLCTNFHMAALGEDDTYFLLCNKDLIQVRPSNDDDHIEWLLSNQQYDRALAFSKERRERLSKYNSNSVATEFLRHLLHDGCYEEAAKLCTEVCGRHKDLWEEYVTTFERHRQLKKLAPYLPTHDPQLEAECYQAVLLDFLEEDVAGFKKYITDWSPDLYRVGAMINETLKCLYQPSVSGGSGQVPPTLSSSVASNLDVENRILLMALAQLYTYERKYERAFAIYLKLEDKYVFHLIDRYQLFPLAKDKIQKLMTIDTDLAVRLLLENEDSLSAQTVMTQLSRQPRLQLAYLDRLFARGEGAEFADLAVTLYAEYNRVRLLPFLRNNEHYRLDKALDVCRQRGRDCVPEIVFLLGRGGNRKEALRVIINESRDINQGIEFCKEHDDRDLWQDLIDYGVQKPEFVTTLMRQIGTHVDPAILIKKIPARSVVPRLRESLVKLLDDYSLQIDLQDGCRRVTIGDCHENFQRLMCMEKRGVSIDPSNTRCVLCFGVLLETGQASNVRGSEIACFRCEHSYHVSCLLDRDMAFCVLCTSGRTSANMG